MTNHWQTRGGASFSAWVDEATAFIVEPRGSPEILAYSFEAVKPNDGPALVIADPSRASRSKGSALINRFFICIIEQIDDLEVFMGFGLRNVKRSRWRRRRVRVDLIFKWINGMLALILSSRQKNGSLILMLDEG
jgi:hypothetical protein